MALSVVILAAGQGKRMRSALPKVLHRLCGKPLLEHAYRAARDLQPEQVYVVYGHGGEQVRDALGYLGVQWAWLYKQYGMVPGGGQILTGPSLVGKAQVNEVIDLVAKGYR